MICPNRKPFRPALESLEDRTVPSTTLTFKLDPTHSSIALVGQADFPGTTAQIQAQDGAGASLKTKLAGTIKATYNAAAHTIAFATSGTSLTFQNGGNWSPKAGGAAGTAPANLGGKANVNLFIFSADATVAVRSVAARMSSGALALTGTTSMAFSSTAEKFGVKTGTADYAYSLNGGNPTSGSTALNTSANSDITNAGAKKATLKDLGKGKFQLSLPISVTINTKVAGYPAHLTVSGTITATAGATVKPPTLTITGPTKVIKEGAAGTTTNAIFTVNLSAALPTDLVVKYSTVNGTAKSGSDFVGGSGSITIAAGTKVGRITIKIKGDNVKEANEKFSVKITKAAGTTIKSPGTATATIANDDV